MLWPDRGLTFSFCFNKVCHLKLEIGEDLCLADLCTLKEVFKSFKRKLPKCTVSVRLN